jgi:ribosome-associated translation inhibitor RaiA
VIELEDERIAPRVCTAGRRRSVRAATRRVPETRRSPILQEFSVAESDSIVEQRLRVVSEFREDERPYVVQQLAGKLDKRLARWDPEQVELELSVKERATPSQKVVLEAWISSLPHLVATSNENELQAALNDVRDDLFKQIDKHVSKAQDRARR